MAAPKIAPTTFRFQPHVKEALLLISDQQGRSMANMLEWLIKQYCENEGMGWPPMNASGKSSNKSTRVKPQAKKASKTRNDPQHQRVNHSEKN